MSQFKDDPASKRSDCRYRSLDEEQLKLNTAASFSSTQSVSNAGPECELGSLSFPTQHTNPFKKQYKQNSNQEKRFLDNIIVGYAFGPKKMETMGLIMAEASKALSTFEAPAMSSSAIANMMNNHEQFEYAELGEESSMTTTAATTLATHDVTTSAGEENARGHYFSDNEEDERSLSSTRTCSAVSQRSQRGGGGGSGGIQLTFLPDSNRFIHLFRKSSNGCGGEGDQSIAGSSVTTMATSATPFRKQSSYKTDQAQSPQALSAARCRSGNSHVELKRHPIRVSFVPIDLDTPLEEQHGGKFDVILHKMTEDILCISKMFRSRRQLQDDVVLEGDEDACGDVEMDLTGLEDMHLSLRQALAEPLDFAAGAGETSLDLSMRRLPATMTRHQARAASRIRRLREYKQKVHTSCVLVDSPSNVLAVMSRADMAEVLSSCLAGVTTKGGIPVRTPRFRVVEEGEECIAGLEVERNESREQTSIDNQYLADEIDHAGFEYPLIAKPLTAAGTKSSHHMGIVMARDGLRRLKTPCLLQEYANHGGKLFKVYVLGDSVWVFARESLPNLPIGERELLAPADDRGRRELGLDGIVSDDAQLPFHRRRRTESYVEFERPAGSRCYVEFNSQRPYPKLSDFGITGVHHMDTKNASSGVGSEKDPTDNRLTHLNEGQSCESPISKKQRLNNEVTAQPFAPGSEHPDLASFVTVEEIAPVTNALRAAFGLELFGFDVLVKHEEGDLLHGEKEILVVDVNYFPGYKEVSNFPSLLAQYLTQKAVESRVQNLCCN